VKASCPARRRKRKGQGGAEEDDTIRDGQQNHPVEQERRLRAKREFLKAKAIGEKTRRGFYTLRAVSKPLKLF